VALARADALHCRRPHRDRFPRRRARYPPNRAQPQERPVRSDGGGDHWAVIASLIETCKLIGVEPHAYLADVITRIVNHHPNSQIDELLPWAYLGTQERWRVA